MSAKTANSPHQSEHASSDLNASTRLRAVYVSPHIVSLAALGDTCGKATPSVEVVGPPATGTS